MKRFWAALQAGIVLSAMAMAGTGQAGEPQAEPSAMTGAHLVRDTLVPRADDLPLLQRKPTLYLAGFNGGVATVAYSMEQGRIVYRVSGKIGAAAVNENRSSFDRTPAKAGLIN